MEDKLKKLSISMDQEISRTKVFTEKDEHQIRSQIKQLSDSISKKATPVFIPKLLTAALFSGIIFSSYYYFDKQLMSTPEVQINKEAPTPVAPVITQQVSGSGLAQYSGERRLTVTFTIKNESKEVIKNSLSYRISFLNDHLVDAAGTRSEIIKPESFSPIGMDESETLSKEFLLKEEVTKEDLMSAIQIEAMNGTKTISSFIISSVDYLMDEKKDPNSNPIVDEKEQNSDQEKERENKGTEEKKEEQAPVPSKMEKGTLSEGEAKQIVTKNLADITRTFAVSGEKNNWTAKNPATYEVAGPDFEPYVTQNFSENILRNLLPNYYCQCDIGYLPRIHPVVRFDIKSVTEDQILISGLEPTGEVNVGDQWTFTLVREGEQWKMDQWTHTSLEGVNLKLTKEEAHQLLVTETQSATFIKEIQINNVNAFVFLVKGPDFEREVTVRSDDGFTIYE